MMAGRIDRDIDLYFLYADDAWDRDSRVLAALYNLGVSVAQMFGNEDAKEKLPDDFNDSLDAIPGNETRATSTDDGLDWVRAREAAKHGK